MNAPEHPLVTWLTAQLHTRARSSIAAKRLRALSELLLLSRHEADAAGEACRHDGEPWPCLEWRATAAGWAHVEGYDPAWTPVHEFAAVVDLDPLIETGERP